MMHSQVWQVRFLDLAKLISTWSKDPSTRVGCVIVAPDKTIISTGYNGFPRGIEDKAEIYADREKKYSRVIHAEMNAILSSPLPLKGTCMYLTHPPCDRCAPHIIQSGVKEVVFSGCDQQYFDRWHESMEKAADIFDEADVQVWAMNESLFVDPRNLHTDCC